MSEDIRFLRESVVDIDAAVVGISKSKWVSVPTGEATSDRALKIMSANRFDIVPIESPAGVSEYFQSSAWNDYSTVHRKTITHRDVIPFTTHLRDVIKGFALDSRSFYFLTRERTVVGLISIANLNCRQVRVYLYGMLSELEVELGNLVSRSYSEAELVEFTFGSSTNEKYSTIKERYHSDKAAGVDVPLVEYLYLSDLLKVMKRDLFRQLGFQSSGKFQDYFGSLVALRDLVAHPTRSLVMDADSCRNLWERIDRIEEILFRLR